MSLHEVQLAPNRPDTWVGLANFARLLTDKKFLNGWRLLLEYSAKTQVTAASIGAFSWATDEDALLKRKRIYRPDAMINLWKYYVRMLQKHEKTS